MEPPPSKALVGRTTPKAMNADNTGQMVKAPVLRPLKQPLSSESYQHSTGGPEPCQTKGKEASGLEEK